MAPSPSQADSGLAPNQRMAMAAAPSSQEKTSASRGRDLAGDQRPVLGAVHELVDVAVDVAVEGAGAAGGERAAHQRGQDQADGREAALGVDHGGQRADQQQFDDAGFRERQVRLGFAGEARLFPGPGRRSAAYQLCSRWQSLCSVWLFSLSGWIRSRPGGSRNARLQTGSALRARARVLAQPVATTISYRELRDGPRPPNTAPR